MVVEICQEGIEVLEDEIRYPPKFDLVCNESLFRDRKPRNLMEVVEINRTWFNAKKPRLMKEYPEKYIAIHKGVPILVGDNPLEVAQKFYKEYGNYPVFIGYLSEKEDVAFFSSTFGS